MILLHLGELPRARPHLEQSLVLYDPTQRRSHRALEDPGVDCLCFAALTLWFLGYPDQALTRSREALPLAQQLSHPYSLALALFFASVLRQFCREAHAVREHAEAMSILATEQGFPLWVALGTVLRGWALAMQGQGGAGVAQMRQGLTAFRATGAALLLTWILALLAEAYGTGGQPEEGLQVLAEALTVVHNTGERQHEAELYRLKGELLLRQGAPDTYEAENCLCQAVAVARQQQAKSFELRAAMSLSRLWQRQGKRQEAYDLLAPVYGWFTEGFGTADLQEAKALLEELGG
jgi:predicted ATPase